MGKTLYHIKQKGMLSNQVCKDVSNLTSNTYDEKSDAGEAKQIAGWFAIAFLAEEHARIIWNLIRAMDTQ